MFKLVAYVKSQYGIHARPSAAIARAAKEKFPQTEITIKNIKTKEEAKADRILELMSMGLPCGAEVLISSSGEEEEMAAKAIAVIIETFEVEIK
jgi:phosphocarrier protein